MRLTLRTSLALLFFSLTLLTLGFLLGNNYPYLTGDKLMLTYKLIQSEFDGSFDTTQLAQGLLSSLNDPSTYYLTPEQYQQIKSEDQNQYTGLGLLYFTEGEYIRILEIIPGTPASQSDLQPGEGITHINDQAIPQLKSHQIATFLRGSSSQPIKLTLNRPINPPLSISLTPTTQQISQLKFTQLENQIGYLKIYQFRPTLESEFTPITQQLQSGAVTKLIIDLRNNPGGNVESALFLAKQFVVNQELMLEKFRSGKTILTHSAPQAPFPELPLVILVNAYTASAAEQLTAALQSNRRATIIGQPTYGKNSIANIFEFPDNSAVHLTIGHWYPPGSQLSTFIGVQPDINILGQQASDEDLILNTAIEKISN